MKIISTLFFIIAIIMGVLGAVSYWKDKKFEDASVVVSATIQSIRVKPFSGKAVARIDYKLHYIRDGVLDSIEHNTTREYLIKNPLPTIPELYTTPFYVRYVPEHKKAVTPFPNRKYVSTKEEYPGFFKKSYFINMLTFIIFGMLIRKFFS